MSLGFSITEIFGKSLKPCILLIFAPVLPRCQMHRIERRSATQLLHRSSIEADMHDTKDRLSLLWLFALLNYLYADVLALFFIVGSKDPAPHLPQWALLGSAVLMEIPIAMILASRLLPFRANRLANIAAGCILTLVNGFLTFVPPLAGWGKPPAFPEYLFFATIETVATSFIICQAWTWSGGEASSSPEPVRRQAAKCNFRAKIASTI